MPTTLSNYYKIVPNRLQKLVLLANYITIHKDHKTIVFFNTRDSVDFYYKAFKSFVADRFPVFGKYLVERIQGDMKQSKRLAVLQAFDEQQEGLLFATDVIARGIDFEKIDSIIQIDIPQDPNFFIHRIGRTARQGKQGKALVIVEQGETPYIDFLKEKLVKCLLSSAPNKRTQR